MRALFAGLLGALLWSAPASGYQTLAEYHAMMTHGSEEERARAEAYALGLYVGFLVRTTNTATGCAIGINAKDFTMLILEHIERNDLLEPYPDGDLAIAAYQLFKGVLVCDD